MSPLRRVGCAWATHRRNAPRPLALTHKILAALLLLLQTLPALAQAPANPGPRQAPYGTFHAAPPTPLTDGQVGNLAIDPYGQLMVSNTGRSYQLLGTPGVGGASATGAAVLVPGGLYQLNCLGTAGGATLQIQSLGADKVTWVSGVTAAGGTTAITSLPTTTTVFVGSSIGSYTPNVRILVTGGTPSGLYCVLS